MVVPPRRGQRSLSAPREKNVQGSGKTVLVVDDSALVRRQVTDALARQGVATVTASEGRHALELLATTDIAVVITDFMMPTMTGLELIAAIRSGSVRADVPIVVLSTLGSGNLVQQGWDLGVKAWIKKPFKPEMLAAAVVSLLGTADAYGGLKCGS
jgi:two-component system chemotaxis response regulator CheY